MRRFRQQEAFFKPANSVSKFQLPLNQDNTGVELCTSGGLINHVYIKVCGNGYGFYAKSHVGVPSTLDQICAAGIVSGVVVNNDHTNYPNAGCETVKVDDRCIDPDCYTKHICNMAQWHVYDSHKNFVPYNVFVYNCEHWATRLIQAWGTNELPDNCRKSTCPWWCIDIHQPGPQKA